VLCYVTSSGIEATSTHGGHPQATTEVVLRNTHLFDVPYFLARTAQINEPLTAIATCQKLASLLHSSLVQVQ